MTSVNNTLAMGSAVYAAKRAADIIFVVENKNQLNGEQLVKQINNSLQEYGEKAPDVTYEDLADIQAVSRQLYAVFAAKSAKKAATLINAILSKYGHVPRLSAHGDTPWHIHIDSSDHAPWAAWFAASSVLALAVLLAEKQHNPGGLCGSPSCGRPFIDLGKGGGRNYCSPRCATRERVAAYRKRK